MDSADIVSWTRIICLWSWAVWGFSYAFWPFLAPPTTNLDQATTAFYKQFMKSMLLVPETTAPDYSEISFMWYCMEYTQLYGAFMFFLVTINTEHFRTRCCQFLVLDRLVLFPAVYLYAAFHYGFQVKWMVCMSLFVAIIFTLLGFVAPWYWPLREASPELGKFEPSGCCERIASWMRGVWLWIWCLQCFLICYPVLVNGDKGVASDYNDNISLYPNKEPQPKHLTDFIKMISLTQLLLNTQFTGGLMFFLATVRTEYYRVCCCLFLAILLTFVTPTYFSLTAHQWGIKTESMATGDATNGAICGFFGILAVGTSWCFKPARALRCNMSKPLLSA